MTAILIVVVAFVLFFVGQGLERAGQWADVLSLAVAVIGTATAVGVAWHSYFGSRRDGSAKLGAEPLLPKEPRKIGSYRLLGRLGDGAVGDVYLGRARNGTLAAVKVMRAREAQREPSRARFEREWRAFDRVSGPRFPELLDADMAAAEPWLALRYEAGLTLEEAMLKSGPWSLPAVAALADGIAEALSAVHKLRIVHRDLKPANILLTERGPLLIDFGVALTESDPRLTRTAMTVGTVSFMSPEQTEPGKAVGPKSDIFSLGSVLVYAATGRPPFGESGGSELRTRIATGAPDLGPLAGLDHPVVALIQRCLNKNPSQRPEVADIMAACDSIVAESDALPAAVRATIERRRRLMETVGGARPAKPWAATARSWVSSGRPRMVRIALVAVIVAAAVLRLPGATPLTGPTTSDPLPPEKPPTVWDSALPKCESPATELHITSSKDKDVLLAEMAAAYGNRRAHGRCVRVVIDGGNSGSVTDELARGWPDPAKRETRPDVWIPTSSLRLEQARAQAAPEVKAIFPPDAEPVMTTPMVIAMPMPMAEALGWQDRELGWSDLADLAADQRGWARHGRREWGRFRLGKTNPRYSTSGLNATLGMFQAARDDPTSTVPLVETEITDGDAKQFVADLERSVVHYGMDTLAFLTNLRSADDAGNGLSYVSAVAMDENSMIAYNLGYPDGTYRGKAPLTPPRTTLAAIYPKEGAYEHDHPYIQLRWPATDGTDARTAVADDFLGYLHWAPQQRKFQKFGFRDYFGNSGPEATPENGIKAGARVQRLTMPGSRVLDTALSTWQEVRKPANVLLLIDTSTSMSDGLHVETRRPCKDLPASGASCLSKLELLKQSWNQIELGFTDKDSVGLWSFSRTHHVEIGMAPMNEPSRSALADTVGALTPTPGTDLYDSIEAAIGTMRATHSEDTINAVVVLSDGRDDGSEMTLAPLKTLLRSQPVRVFTIAYGLGSDADKGGDAALEEIASASNAANHNVSDTSSSISDTAEQLIAAIISNF